MLETICIAFLGTVVGAVLAIPLSFLTASNLVPKPIAFVGRMAIMAIRTVPSLVYGLMFVRVTGMGAFAGLMTMALSSIGMAVSYTHLDLNRTLGKKELMGIAIGQIIGAGVMSMMGVAIAMTGRSANLAFMLSAVFTMCTFFPSCLLYTSRCV